MLSRAILFALAVGAPVAADAATMKAVYTGEVFSSYDLTGVFGVAEDDPQGLDGLDFVLTFIYDTAKGTIYDFGNATGISGGTFYGTPSPIISAAITINSVTRSMVGAYQGQVDLQDDVFDLAQHYAFDLFNDPETGDSVNEVLYAQIFGEDLGIPASLTTPFVANGGLAGYSGYFQFINYLYGGEVQEYAYGNLEVKSLTVTEYEDDMAPVPLPAGAGLLAGALTLLGALRARRRFA